RTEPTHQITQFVFSVAALARGQKWLDEATRTAAGEFFDSLLTDPMRACKLAPELFRALGAPVDISPSLGLVPDWKKTCGVEYLTRVRTWDTVKQDKAALIKSIVRTWGTAGASSETATAALIRLGS